MNNDDHLYGLNNPCFYSSLFFITNIIIAYYYDEYVYLLLFAALLITSLVTHFTQNKWSIYLDKSVIFMIIVYGFYVFMNKCVYIETNKQFLFATIIFATFWSCVILYLSNLSNTPISFCGVFGNFLHVIIHILGSVGHNMIVMM